MTGVRARRRGALVLAILASLAGAGGAAAAPGAACEFWVSTDGDDDNPGTRAEPWAGIEHAAEAIPDRGCTVWVEPGVYTGRNKLDRRFTREVVFRSVSPYRAVLEHDSTVVDLNGATRIALEGFELRHDSEDARDYVVKIDRSKRGWSEHITLRDNVIHDSYDNDLLKVHNGVRWATIAGNVFYNQGPSEQHIDVNSVTDVVVEDNLFFNDFAASGRSDPGDTKHYVLVKDSNADDDGLLGSRRVTIRRNVFLNWQGGEENIVKVGNDGKPYHEAVGVRVENNLFVGNSPVPVDAAFGVRGARDVAFVNNTVAGPLPSKAYAYRLHLKNDNPRNERIVFANNIWSDHTGTMGSEAGSRPRLALADPDDVDGLVHSHNLYDNGGRKIPGGSGIDPAVDDRYAVLAGAGLVTDHDDLVLPYWLGEEFASGATSIRTEFVRLVTAYGRIPPDSPAVDAADPRLAPPDDILGRRRTVPDIGAYEASAPGSGDAVRTAGDEPAGVVLLLVPAVGAALLLGVAVPLWWRRRANRQGDRRGRRVAYVVGTYPQLTTTFIDREVRALREDGVTLRVVSLRRPDGPLSEDQRILRAQTRYVLPCPPGTLLASAGYVLVTRPITACRTLAYLLSRPHASWRARGRTLLHVGEGVVVAYLLRAEAAGLHLHAHFLDRATTVALVAARLLGVTFSATAHASDIYVAPALLPEKLTAARFVATCTAYNAAHLEAQVPEGRTASIVCVRHGLDLERYPAPAWRNGTAPPVLLAVGQLKEKKGFDHLLAACRLLRDAGYDFTCRIVGDGPLRARLEEEVVRLGLRRVARLCGALAHDAVVAQYRAAAIFVLPCVTAPDGDRDGIPNVLLEAMAMRLPVVSTRVSGIPEAVEHGHSGLLVAPGDAAALARALAALLDDPALRAAMGARGREAVAARFDVTANTRRLLACLERALA